jgi:hypothetical protein
VLVTPTSSGLRPAVQLLDPTNAVIGSATAAAAGQNAVLQTVASGTATGVYKIVVSSAGATTGNYTVQITLNAALESEGLVSGATDNTLGTAQFIASSATVLGGAGSAARRLAVVGQTDGSPTYSAAAAASTFDNISTTGAAISFTNTDDGATQIPIGFTFALFGTTYTNVFVSTNGLLTFGTADTDFTNADLTSSPTQAAIAPFWDDLIVAGATNSHVYDQVLGSGASARLVIQWNNVSFFSDTSALGGLTFEAELGADGSIRLNYQSLATGRDSGSHDFGISATAGIKDAGTQGASRLLLMFNNGPTSLINSFKSVLISPPVATTADFYAFNAAAGETDSMVIAGLAPGNLTLDLENGSGTIITSAAAGPTNVTRAISQVTFATAGTYYLRAAGNAAVPYSLVVTRNAAFDVDPNGTFATAQSLATASTGALGNITGGATPIDDWYSFSITGEQSLNLTTYTPADGSGQFVNSLAPKIELYNASNQLVASGTVLADGRNESLSLVINGSGTYRARVTAKNSTSGEYFLGVGRTTVSTIQAIAIDDGTAQRSRVRSITLTFNGTIVTAPSSAFHLVRTEDGLAVPVIVSAITPIGGQTQILLTFDGASLDAGSLADGHYTLSIDGSQIIDSNGQAADAAGNGVVGSTRNVSLLRFFGDTNGDGIVDANDYLTFRAAYLSGDATGLNSAYDRDGDGVFTTADLQAFTDNLLNRVL